MQECGKRGVHGIVTTTSRVNVEALLPRCTSARWQEQFAAVVCGEDVHQKKPDPEVYRIAPQVLGIAPLDAVAIEIRRRRGCRTRRRGAGGRHAQRILQRRGDRRRGRDRPGPHERSGWRPRCAPRQARRARASDWTTCRRGARSATRCRSSAAPDASRRVSSSSVRISDELPAGGRSVGHAEPSGPGRRGAPGCPAGRSKHAGAGCSLHASAARSPRRRGRAGPGATPSRSRRVAGQAGREFDQAAQRKARGTRRPRAPGSRAPRRCRPGA